MAALRRAGARKRDLRSMLQGRAGRAGARLVMTAHKKTLEERIAAVVRLLASDKDGEVVAAVNALKRTLASAGTDINGLALGIENLGKNTVVPDEIKKKIWDAAVQHTENRLHEIGRASCRERV